MWIPAPGGLLGAFEGEDTIGQIRILLKEILDFSCMKVLLERSGLSDSLISNQNMAVMQQEKITPKKKKN